MRLAVFLERLGVLLAVSVGRLSTRLCFVS